MLALGRCRNTNAGLDAVTQGGEFVPPTRNVEKLNVVLLAISITMLAWAPGAWAQTKYKTVHKFRPGTTGGAPQAGVVFDRAGNLYGTAGVGGNRECESRGCGVVYKLTPNMDGGWTESVLYAFCSLNYCDDGYLPDAGLIFDEAGNLYSTTRLGGTENGGTVFKLTANEDGSWGETVLYSFCPLNHCADGSVPSRGVISDANGNLYGTTLAGGNSNCDYGTGCGVVFKLSPNADGTWTENVLHTFCPLTNCNGDGATPAAGLVFDSTGNLYGTTIFGGIAGYGTIFN
jgi:uncharacterized repeat protein (TIGR03803 family)